MPDRSLSDAEAATVVAGLLAWFHGRDRDVPWRGERDPYRIWVGEVMAQQTRIDTVRPFYERFLSRFPSVEALAEAELDDLLRVWAGLGYYSRARHLRTAAREIMASYGGSVPSDRAALQELPGVGPYTSGAIASLAFGQPEPAIDGNTRRVLSRFFDNASPTAAGLEEAARRIIEQEPGRAAAINQSLMDLGGEICTPRAPRCEICPLAGHCRALARDTVDERPPRRRRKPLPHRHHAAGVVRRAGRLLIVRRPANGLLGGLWEFPGAEVRSEEAPDAAVRRGVLAATGVEVEVGDLLQRVPHAFSHFRITLCVYAASHVSGRARAPVGQAVRWVEPHQLGRFAFSAATERVVERLTEAAPAGS